MKIKLFTTYFISNSKKRQLELDSCLINNLKNSYINQINVFLDHKTKSSNFYHFFENEELHPYCNKLNFICLDKMPTYKNWIEHSSANTISLFSNADIYFDKSINKISDYLTEPNNIICLSRHEDLLKSTKLHPNPHWSQDVWAINGNHIQNINFLPKLDIPTGQFRCDNKFAYIMSIYGWNLYNPCNTIKCYHKHLSNIRTYDPVEINNIGGLAFVYPCEKTEASKIDIQIMSLNTKNVTGCSMNNWLEKIVEQECPR